MMKLNKSQIKELTKSIEFYAKKDGFCTKNNSIFCFINEYFACCDFLVVNATKIVYRISVKKSCYDDIFWNLMNIKGKKTDSLRACGAFKAPSVLLKKGEIEISDDHIDVSLFLIHIINDTIEKFISEDIFLEYVFGDNIVNDKNILQCLEYLSQSNIQAAKLIAQKQLDLGNIGKFSNEGKGFFEWILYQYR